MNPTLWVGGKPEPHSMQRELMMCLLMLIPTVIRLIVERTHAWLTKETELDDKVDLGILLDHQKVLMSQYLESNARTQLHSGGPLLTDKQDKNTAITTATSRPATGTTAIKTPHTKHRSKRRSKRLSTEVQAKGPRGPNMLRNRSHQQMKHHLLDLSRRPKIGRQISPCKMA